MTSSATTIDRGAIARMRRETLPRGTKGLPLGAHGLRLDEVGAQGWHVLSGDVPLPLLTLREAALAHNVETMAEYCRREDVLLAPHGKTTMAPQIFAPQIEAGAWAMTAATPAHLSVYRAFGVGRVFYANQLLDPAALRYAAAELRGDADFELYSLVDSVEGVARMTAALEGERLDAPFRVLLEVGHLGGRTGVRTVAEGIEVAAAVEASPVLALAGMEAFEGTTGAPDAAGDLVELLGSVVVACVSQGYVAADGPLLVSAGGSTYFDIVVETLGALRTEFPYLQPILRSGCYVTHDGGFYAEHSPFGHDAPAGAPQLQDALELWAFVQSRPEPGVAILGAGKRDFPIDMGPPKLVRSWRAGRGFERWPADATQVGLISDQHLQLRVPADASLAVGDVCVCAVSHPCTAFDKWRFIPVIDDDLSIVDGIRTFF